MTPSHIEKKYTTIFEDIAKKQYELNDFTAGNNWEIDNINKKTGKTISWMRASWMEAAEFVGSFDWKHWKKDKEDISNAKIELVDILHFLTSQLIRDVAVVKIKNNEKTEESRQEIVEIVAEHWVNVFMSQDVKNTSKEKDMYQLAEEFVKEIIGEDKTSIKALSIFASLCLKMDLEPETLYKMYMVKNVLNQFRQENGYKDGSYIKIWSHPELGEVEDNVVATYIADSLLQAGKSINQTLTDELSIVYANCKMVVTLKQE